MSDRINDSQCDTLQKASTILVTIKKVSEAGSLELIIRFFWGDMKITCLLLTVINLDTREAIYDNYKTLHSSISPTDFTLANNFGKLGQVLSLLAH